MRCKARLIVDTNCNYPMTPTVVECELEEHVGGLHLVKGEADDEYDFLIAFGAKAEPDFIQRRKAEG